MDLLELTSKAVNQFDHTQTTEDHCFISEVNLCVVLASLDIADRLAVYQLIMVSTWQDMFHGCFAIYLHMVHFRKCVTACQYFFLICGNESQLIGHI